MDYRKTLDDLTKLLEELQQENQNTPIIVEGIHDKNALKKLGITGTIIPLNKGLPIANFCDQISTKYTKSAINPREHQKICMAITHSSSLLLPHTQAIH